eukprot:316389-Hanusia_phi.AAC.3
MKFATGHPLLKSTPEKRSTVREIKTPDHFLGYKAPGNPVPSPNTQLLESLVTSIAGPGGPPAGPGA